MKAFAYLRVSGETQLAGSGIDRQRETIQAWANRSGYEIPDNGWYQDAWTGTDADRPGFAAMLADLNGVRTIAIECLDRLARDSMVQAILISRLAAAEVTLFAALTGEDVTESMRADPMRRAMIQIQGVFAELEKNVFLRRVRKGKESKRRAGIRCDGPKPYGELDGEAETLSRIRAMRASGLTLEALASALNRGDVLPRYGGVWTAPTLCRILKRPPAQ